MGHDHDDSDDENPGGTMNPLMAAWRGLANYRTQMKRSALKRDRGQRTTSDVYLLEDTISNVRFLCDLPIALRLKICEVLGYELHQPGYRVTKQGGKAFYFFIIFTGSVKCTYHQLGVQEDKTWIIPAGKWFGDKVLEDWNYTWEYTIATNEKTELLTLTRRDYERVLDIKKTPELRQRGIERFKTVPRQSLLRLANVLSHRVYSKNRNHFGSAKPKVVHTSSKGFILSQAILAYAIPPVPNGRQRERERLVAPVIGEAAPSYHASGSSSKAAALASRSIAAAFPLALAPPFCAIDTVFGLVKRCKTLRKCKSTFVSAVVNRCQSEVTPIALVDSPLTCKKIGSLLHCRSSTGIGVWRRGSSGGAKDMKRRATTLERMPIGSLGEMRNSVLLEGDRPEQWGSPQGSIEAIDRSGTSNGKEKKTPSFPITKDNQPHWPFIGGMPVGNGAESQFSLMQMHFSDNYGGKLAKKNKYSLRLFLHDCHQKEREHRMAEFGEKDHWLWQMGFRGDQKMPGIVGETNKYYQEKFDRWARHIIDREKKLLSYNTVMNTEERSFMPGIATSDVMKLYKGVGKDGRPQHVPAGQEKQSTILDIGCLKAGDYFGERGLVTATKRAASIVAVTMVETLVLTKWDFHRHCDRQVLKVFKAHEYKKKKRMFRNYQRTRKWERYKRDVVTDVLETKARRFRVGPRPIRVLPKRNRTKRDLPIKEWLFKSHPTVLPSFPNADPFALLRATMAT